MADESEVFCDVMPCGPCINRRFGGNYRLHYQDEIFSQVGTLAVTSNSKKRVFPKKRRLLQKPHDVSSQKTTFLIVRAVETSNLTSPT
jgi:hypothetical protein